MTFDPVEIAKGEPWRFWHVNDECDVRVDTDLCCKSGHHSPPSAISTGSKVILRVFAEEGEPGNKATIEHERLL